MKRKKFETILFKNIIALIIPAMMVFVVLVYMFTSYPLFDEVKCNNLDKSENILEDIEYLYECNTKNVECNTGELEYTGFDYYVDGKLKGAYYYCIENEKIIMYLIKTNMPILHLDTTHIKGKIIKDEVTGKHIITQFAEASDMDVSLFSGFNTGYIISELDYPYAYIYMIYVFFMVPIVVSVLIIIYALLVFVNPAMHSQSRKLEQFGEVNKIIDEINLELAEHFVYKYKNIYVTDNYLIVSYLNKTDVIKLDNIKYLSKNLLEKSRYSLQRRTFRLTMSNPGELFYELDIRNENAADKIVDAIRGVI